MGDRSDDPRSDDPRSAARERREWLRALLGEVAREVGLALLMAAFGWFSLAVFRRLFGP